MVGGMGNWVLWTGSVCVLSVKYGVYNRGVCIMISPIDNLNLVMKWMTFMINRPNLLDDNSQLISVHGSGVGLTDRVVRRERPRSLPVPASVPRGRIRALDAIFIDSSHPVYGQEKKVRLSLDLVG